MSVDSILPTHLQCNNVNINIYWNVWEKDVQKNILTKREKKAVRTWRKLSSFKNHNLYSSPKIVTMVKPFRIISLTGKLGNIHSVLYWKLETNRQFREGVKLRRRIILKLTLKK